MPTREIPESEWREFFDAFSRRHDGWLATVEVLGDMGAQVEAEELPLRGATADRGEDGPTVTLLLGNRERHVTHRVKAVTHVRLDQSEEGADIALQLQSKEGETTLLRFRSAVLPETVDGILPGR